MRSRKYFYYFDGNYPQDVANMGYNVWNWDAQDSVMWQESGKVNRVANNGDPVAVWTDTVSGVDAVQATTANKPTYATASLNGLPTLSFDGGDLLATANISISTFAVWTVFRNSVDAQNFAYEHGINANVDGFALSTKNNLYMSNVARTSVRSTITATPEPTDNVYRVTRLEYNGTSSTHKLYYDSSVVSTPGLANNPGSTTLNQALYIGARSTIAGAITGNIAHLCIVSPYPTPAIIAQMETYINQKWGIYTDDAIADASNTYTVFDWDASRSDTLFQDSGATTPVTSDTDPVGAWVDRISSINAIQATTANKPTYTTASLNGLPTLSFDGSDLLATGNIGISTFAVWAVYKINASNNCIVEHSANSSVNDGFNLSASVGATLLTRRSGANSLSSDAIDYRDDVFRLFRLEFNSKSQMIVNGTVRTAGATISTGTATQPLFIGARSGVALPLTGNIAQLVIVTPYPDATTIARIEAQLNEKWGIY